MKALVYEQYAKNDDFESILNIKDIPEPVPKIIRVENFSNLGSAESELFHVYTVDAAEIWIKDPSQN